MAPRVAILLLGLITSIAAPVSAQRAFVSGSYVSLPTTDSFSTTTTSSLNRETSSVTSHFETASGNGLNAGVLVRVWKMLLVGGGLTNVTRSTSGTLNGSYPHPFFFNLPRTASATFTGADRKEQAIQANLGVAVLSSRRASVLVFGGASFFNVTQPYAQSLSFTDTYPYDSITGATPVAATQSSSFTGINVGGDVAWYFLKNLGAGAGVLFATGSSRTTEPFEIKAGNVNFGIGLRLRF